MLRIATRETENGQLQVRGQLIEAFEKNSSELYWLAYLLTGNEDRSGHAFSRALDLDEEINPVFDGFMNRWARKLIVVEALGAIKTELRRSMLRVAREIEREAPAHTKWTQRQGIAKQEFEEAVLAIDAFPRCAMLLTIFEGMPIPAAASLLHAEEALTGGRDPYPGQGRAPVPVWTLG